MECQCGFWRLDRMQLLSVNQFIASAVSPCTCGNHAQLCAVYIIWFSYKQMAEALGMLHIALLGKK